MKTLRISKTIFPKDKPSDFNEWAQFFWGLYGKELDRVKNIKNGNLKEGKLAELSIDENYLVQKLISSVKNLITTEELDNNAANICNEIYMKDYNLMASRFYISNFFNFLFLILHLENNSLFIKRVILLPLYLKMNANDLSSSK